LEHPNNSSQESEDAMRTAMWTVLMVSAVVMTGCGGDNADGTYRGKVIEGDKVHEMELVLSGDEGALTLLSSGGPDAGQGDSWQLRDVKIQDGRVSFVVPMARKAQEDDDDLLFDLKIEGDRLVGTGREDRKQAKDLPVTFRKQ
jgi:hypothetical protein